MHIVPKNYCNEDAVEFFEYQIECESQAQENRMPDIKTAHPQSINWCKNEDASVDTIKPMPAEYPASLSLANVV